MYKGAQFILISLDGLAVCKSYLGGCNGAVADL